VEDGRKEMSNELLNYLGLDVLKDICHYLYNFFNLSSGIFNKEYQIIFSNINEKIYIDANKFKKCIYNDSKVRYENNCKWELKKEYFIYESNNNHYNILIPIVILGNSVGFVYVNNIFQNLFYEEYSEVNEIDSKEYLIIKKIFSFFEFYISNHQKIELLNKKIEFISKKEAENSVDSRVNEERFRLVLEGSQLGFWDWNLETGEVVRNERWAEMLGYTLDEIKFTTKQWEDFLHPEDRKIAWESIDNHLQNITSIHEMEYRLLTKDGSYKWILDRAMVTIRDSNGKPLRMSGTHSDISEKKKIEKELLYWANHDKLTNLYNRTYFEHKLSCLTKETDYPVGVMVLDIDNLKYVNDTFGHLIGDELIKKSSKILSEIVEGNDFVARTGGDEFTILIFNATTIKLNKYIEKILVIEEEDKSFIPVRLSVGADISERFDDLKNAIDKADKNMYIQKKNRKNM
jgi:PAS domain S-box/diguanylate cyclase (GGDEF) domain